MRTILKAVAVAAMVFAPGAALAGGGQCAEWSQISVLKPCGHYHWEKTCIRRAPKPTSYVHTHPHRHATHRPAYTRHHAPKVVYGDVVYQSPRYTHAPRYTHVPATVTHWKRRHHVRPAPIVIPPVICKW